MTKVDELIEQCGNAHSKGLIGVGRGEILYILNEAATALTDLQAQVAAGDSAKWQVKHTDTMNTLVQMGMARDQAEAECAALKAQVAAGNAALAQFGGNDGTA